MNDGKADLAHDPEVRRGPQVVPSSLAAFPAMTAPDLPVPAPRARPVIALVILGLAVFGIGTATMYHHRPHSDGDDRGAVPPAGFSQGHDRVVFVLDCRAALLNRIGEAKQQISRALKDLKPSQSFDVVFGNAAKTTLYRDALVPATPETVEAATRYLEAMPVENSTGLGDEVAAALKLNPNVVWVVASGDNDPETLARISRYNASYRVRINTIVRYAEGDSLASMHNLWQIAHDNGGVCIGDDGKPIAEPTARSQPRELPDGADLLRE